MQAGDVFREFVDFFVKPRQFGVFVDKAGERNHVFRAINHKGSRFGFGLICGEDAHAVQSSQREQATFLLGEMLRSGGVLPADDERQRFAGGDVHVGADFAHAKQGLL